MQTNIQTARKTHKQTYRWKFLVNLHRFPDGHTTYFTLNVIVQQCKDGRTARQTKTERDRQRETYFIRKNRQTFRQTDTQAQRYRRRTDRRIERKIDRRTDRQTERYRTTLYYRLSVVVCYQRSQQPLDRIGSPLQ